MVCYKNKWGYSRGLRLQYAAWHSSGVMKNEVKGLAWKGQRAQTETCPSATLCAKIQKEPPETESRTLWLEVTSIFSSVIQQDNQVAYIRIHV
jgi:hypothetical protein